MSKIQRSDKLYPYDPSPPNDSGPKVPAQWGPFLGFIGGIALAGFTYASTAHSPTNAIVVGSIAAVTILAALYALKR